MVSTVVETQTDILRGKCSPLGATFVDGGVNFSVFSRKATGMELVLFPSTAAPSTRIIELNPQQNKTYNYWHIFVPGITHGQEYCFRAHGPFNPERGHRFDAEKMLVDPYAKAIVGWDTYDRKAACVTGDNSTSALRAVAVDGRAYDWEGDAPLRHNYAASIIYEMHVGGFTANPNSAVAKEMRGTFSGVVEKIPYLKELGVTAVQLMPVQEFDPEDAAEGLCNYWGYNTLGFLAVHHGYCSGSDPVSGINEFRDMVKALHKADIEVILDVVFNHTSEGNENGPTQSFRGLDNSIYYLLEHENKTNYSNYSGCGNSFNVNHPVVGRLVLDSLRYWVSEMHVDGFRFDLAAALARDVFGRPLDLPPLLWTIESDPVLAGSKLIAEAWDAAGLYKVGWFVNTSQWYAEWNGPFRDDVRKFVKGETDTVPALAARLTGSSDLYIKPNRETSRSINFVTCHDGFTLADLVSYNGKHNEMNGEHNRDGNDANYSWNCGAEGPTSQHHIEQLRARQIKNFMTILLLSQGTPMILMGDEVGRTQQGNNNAYCQDNELNWFDWDLLKQNDGLFRFVKNLIAFTQSLQVFRQRNTISTEQVPGKPYMVWHGTEINQPDWSTGSHSLAFTVENPGDNERLHVMFNAYWDSLEFKLPEAAGKVWKRMVDTSLSPPRDIASTELAETVPSSSYTVPARSAVILYSAQKID